MPSFAELIAAAAEDDAAAVAELVSLAQRLAPDSVEGVSYGVAALRQAGRPLIGIGATAQGFSVYPFSPAVVSAVAANLPGHRISKGAIGFSGAQPLPRAVAEKLISLRLAEIEQATR